MFKLLFGLLVVGLILFIIYQTRKEGQRVKGIMEADDSIHDAQTKLQELGKRDELVDLHKQVHKREKKLSEKQTKLDAKSDKE